MRVLKSTCQLLKMAPTYKRKTANSNIMKDYVNSVTTQLKSSIILCEFQSVSIAVLLLKSVCLPCNEAKRTETLEFGAEKRFITGTCKVTDGLCPKKPQTTQKVSASTFKGKLARRGLVSCYKLLEFFILAAVTQGRAQCSCKPPTKHMLFSVLYMNRFLKLRILRMGSPICFRLQVTSCNKMCRVTVSKHQQQSTKVKAKGTDLT